MISGIYCIKSISKNKVYIGQSVNIKRRLKRHQSQLETGKHENDILQKHYNKYGLNDLSFEILECCGLDSINEREQYWISFYDSMNRRKGFNMESGGNAGKEFSKERKLAITGEKNPMYGKKWNETQREKIPFANRANSKKLTEKQVCEIKYALLNGEEQKDIAERYNIKFCTVNKIKKCKNWYWVAPEINEKLINLSDEKRIKTTNQIKEMIDKGFAINKIAKTLGHEPTTIKRLAQEHIYQKKITEQKQKKELNEKVLQSFRSGRGKTETCNQFNISFSVYTKIISKEYRKNKTELKEKIILMKRQGVKGKDIASILNIHTCTVTEYLKKYMPEALKKYTKRESC